VTDGDKTLAWVQKECGIYRQTCQARKLASADEIEAAWPADDANLKAWVQCYGQLRAWLWTMDAVPTSRQQAEERLLAALAEEPEPVDLEDGSVVWVHPKSLHALLWFRSRDYVMSWLGERLANIRAELAEAGLEPDDLPEPASTLDEAADEVAFQLAAMAAVACSEGAALDKSVAENPPERFLSLSPWELMRINRAFAEVNAGRLLAVEQIAAPLPKSDKTGRRMSWNVLYGTLGMRTGTDPEYLARNRSLVNVVSQVRVSAQPASDREVERDLGG
jgi:hypothetical protein